MAVRRGRGKMVVWRMSKMVVGNGGAKRASP